MQRIDRFGLWWPELEHKTDELFGYMLRRVTDVDVAVKQCRTTGVAVQAGGFIGMWPRRLAKFFEYVYTFEPVDELYDCLKLNTEHLPSVITQKAVLGASVDETHVSVRSGGRTRPAQEGQPVAQVTIDSLSLPRCDAIFLDVERSELAALDGALQTIGAWSPVIVLEMKSDTEEEFNNYMRRLGYLQVARVHADAVFARARK